VWTASEKKLQNLIIMVDDHVSIRYLCRMPVPHRLLRACTEDLPNEHPMPSAKACDERERILRVATRLMSRFGRLEVTMAGLALAMKTSQAAIRRQFADMDMVLSEILNRHMQDLARILGQVPQSAPNRQSLQRTAYVTTTRGAFSLMAERHTILLRDRYCLPPDLLEPIETLRRMMGETLAGPLGAHALCMLDAPEFLPEQIESLLETLASPAETLEEQKPAPPPPPPHKPAIRLPTLANRARYLNASASTPPAPVMAGFTPSPRAGPSAGSAAPALPADAD
jgi:AcrR family transcriptional regulator